MPLLHEPIRSIQPPSNSVQTDSLYTEPAQSAQISLDDWDMAAPLLHILFFCCLQTG